MKEKTCCFTGHRIIPNIMLDIIKQRLEENIIHLVEKKGVTVFLAGGALGFDTLAAKTVLSLRERYPEIKLKLYFPCFEQCKGWRSREIEVYENIKAQANEYKYISGQYIRGCMQMRNRALVDDSSYCICYFTKDKSGTAYTVKYGENKGLEIINLALGM